MSKVEPGDYVGIRLPAHLRIGQSLYCFLCWCARKGYMPNVHPMQEGMGDPFNTPDADISRYWLEWLKHGEENNRLIAIDGTGSKENTD